MRRFGAAAAVAAIFMGAAGPAHAAPSPVVVSQAYGGGGNGGATYTNDFIEVFNRGGEAVDLDGWSVQYLPASPGPASQWQVTALGGSLTAGAYRLVQEAQGAGGTTSLPAPDHSGNIAMSFSAGTVALVRTATALTCRTAADCAADSRIADLLGYGSAVVREGSPAESLTTSTAALRGAGGCTDTDDNARDFTAGAPAPRNSASPVHACGSPRFALASTDPRDGATGTPADADVALTFSEPATVEPGFAAIACARSGSHPYSTTGGPATFVLNPDADFAGGESCTVSVDGDRVHPASDPSATAPDASFTFTTAEPPTPVHAIQGAGHRSPLLGRTVTTSGVVTHLAGNGFWLQGLQPDGDPATSEGLFVFTSGRPQVAPGDAVRVTGRVAEFRPGGASTQNLTTTQLTGPSIDIVSSGHVLPDATVVGRDGRMPSATVIEDDATDVEVDGVFDPALDGIDFYESLEGMRVQVDDAVASGPTNDFGELSVLPDGGEWASVRTPRGGVVVREGDFNPERVILDDGAVRTPAADVGDTLPGATVGVLDYSFGNFKLLLTAVPLLARGGLERETTSEPGVGELAFATLNVENLDSRDPASKFDRLAAVITENLRAPDVISLEEVQDDNGATNDGVVSADATYDRLIGAVRVAGGPAYEYRQIDPVDGADGGQPGGNIRVGFLFRTDRGLAFADRPGGDATTPVAVEPGPRLSVSPGRIEPQDPAFERSRKPLAGEFSYDGQPLFVVANHWNSKGGDDPLFGRRQPPRQVTAIQRDAQARIVGGFVHDLLAADEQARVVVMGDLNDFSFSTPLRTLTGNGEVLEDLILRLPEGERYTYVFDGNSQDLDHLLMSPAAARRVSVVDAVHVNAEFADQVSDHDPVVAIACADVTPPALDVTVTPDAIWPPNHRYHRITATPSAGDSVDPSPAVELVSVTSSEPDDAPGDADGTTRDDVRVLDDTTFDLRAERDETGPGRVYTVTYRATDACGNTVERSAAVAVRRS